MNKTIFLATAIHVLTTACLHAQGVWTQKAAFGAGAITEARAFAIGNKGYIGAATPFLWEYDPGTDAWTQKASFPGPTRESAVGFTIGTTGYFGTGNSYNDFWAYDAVSNMWTQKANFGGTGREGAVGCTVNGKGYLGLGGNYLNDWWEYDPGTDSWTQKANLAGPGRYHAGAFSIANHAYVSCGFNGSFFNDLWEYDPAGNTWTAKANLPGPALDRPVGLSSGSKGYILTGWTGGTALADAYMYDAAGNNWTQIPDFGGAPRYNACGFAVGSQIFVGTGYANGAVADIWAYGNSCNVQTSSAATSCTGNCDGTATVDFPDPAAALSYLWSTGATTQTVANLCAGAYTVSVTDTAGCSTTVTVIVSDPPPVTAAFTDSMPTCHGGVDGAICAIPAGGVAPYSTFLWSTGDTTACIQPVPAGLYTVTITDSAGCSGTATHSLPEPTAISLSFLPTNSSCQTCSDGSASANVSGGVVPYTYNWSNGGTLVFIAGLLPGTYTCCVTDANGCMQCDSVVVGYVVGIPDKGGGTYTPVHPNPCDDRFHVSIAGVSATTDVTEARLNDTAGRRLRAEYTVSAGQVHFRILDPVPGLVWGEIWLEEKVIRFRVLAGIR